MKKVKLIIPSIPKDMGILLANIELFYLNLPIDKIIIIGPHELENLLTPLPQIEFLCEDIIIDKDRIKDIINSPAYTNFATSIHNDQGQDSNLHGITYRDSGSFIKCLK